MTAVRTRSRPRVLRRVKIAGPRCVGRGAGSAGSPRDARPGRAGGGGAAGAGPGRAAVHSVRPGMALTLRDGTCVFYDLELAQAHILQEEGLEKSAESKAAEKPPDTLLMEVQVPDKVKI